MNIIIVLAIILCIVNLVYPEFGWYINAWRYLWLYKDEKPEPSDAYKTITRIGACIMIVVLLILLFF